ncbi:tetracycline repressor-like protein [Murinocardiopsis flavida]|uniref:Tetracycline repressor-like protein n=1 Tax=Murinocardiopsis flavida TaxID=645275 RepID=A0A2P8DUY3_9ACTN|nr:tetracycline repressor-like protein [Murinocardiopsis flavida]
MRILLDAGFTEREAAGVSRLLAAHVLSSVEEHTAVRPADDTAPDAAPPFHDEHLAGHEHLRRVAPYYAGLGGDDIFELGIEVILDGLAHRHLPRS